MLLLPDFRFKVSHSIVLLRDPRTASLGPSADRSKLVRKFENVVPVRSTNLKIFLVQVLNFYFFSILGPGPNGDEPVMICGALVALLPVQIKVACRTNIL